MGPVVSLCLACSAFLVGTHLFTTHRGKKNMLWLLEPDGRAKSPALPFSTRVYIVRAWTERTRRDDQSVTRYVLEGPTTGRRHGYTSVEALLEALSMELTSA